MKRLRASQKQHAINEKLKAETKLADDEGAPVIQDLWGSDDEGKMSDDADDDDPLAFHKKITKVGWFLNAPTRFYKIICPSTCFKICRRVSVKLFRFLDYDLSILPCMTD